MAKFDMRRVKRPRNDETGRRYGKLVGISYIGDNTWLWQCDCGNQKQILAYSVRKGATQSCGCIRGPSQDITGQRFTLLTAIRPEGAGELWRFRCDCGNEIVRRRREVMRGDNKSCGCARYAFVAASKIKYNLKHSGSVAYQRWLNMRTRCNPNTKHKQHQKDYVARGITVCEEWLNDPHAFIAHVGEPPEPGLSLDRIDNDKGYEPGNVRWATRSEQMLNRRKPVRNRP